MLMGAKFSANPSVGQVIALSSWMGASKFIWNAKCDEDKYLRKFAVKFLPKGTFPKIDKAYAQYKTEISKFLEDCPSQILRNSASNWYNSYQESYKQKDRGRPKRKKRGQGMSIWLTRELFRFDTCEESGQLRLFVGQKKNNIGYLNVNWHDRSWEKHGPPNSIRIKKNKVGKFTVSFCYGEAETANAEKSHRKEFLKHLEARDREELEHEVIGIDRGVNILAATESASFHPSKKDRSGLAKYQQRTKRHQKVLSRRVKGSRRRNQARVKLAIAHNKVASIRDNFCHQITKKLVDMDKKVFILEGLKVKNMTATAKGNGKRPGKNVRAKSGLNRAILNMSWGKIETYLRYKARKNDKVVFKINAAYTSQECADCDHIHPDNRKGTEFKCVSCGHTDHADTNASKVMKKRAINLILNSGTELLANGTLRPKTNTGRGAVVRPISAKAKLALVSKRQKRRSA